MIHPVEVKLWGTTIGAVALTSNSGYANFAYDRDFAGSGIQISPIAMPLSMEAYSFPHLAMKTFRGLPGLLSDSLPDKFGNTLINAWLATQGRKPESFNVLERLCYTGSRGMGALEFVPATGPRSSGSTNIQIAELVNLASEILTQREGVNVSFAQDKKHDALTDILRVGTSAGGARAKALIAWNPETNEVRSGQINAGSGFEYWLLKFDGVSGNKDKELEDSKGYGDIEYAYYLMAQEAGIDMSECRIFKEGPRRHFMTKRFDRLDDGDKLHTQSLCAIAHYDFNAPGSYSYEQALMTMRDIGLSMDDIEQQYRRMAFNIVARNQDDHTKNIEFIMNRSGEWSLSPAFDVTYSYNPSGDWTSTHQMTMNQKRDNFTREDFRQCSKSASMKKGCGDAILDEICSAVRQWPDFAQKAQVAQSVTQKIARAHRLGTLSE